MRQPGISAAQIYRYLRGDTDLAGYRLGILLDALDLEVRRKAASPRRDPKLARTNENKREPCKRARVAP
jgi:hypothetical protein